MGLYKHASCRPLLARVCQHSSLVTRSGICDLGLQQSPLYWFWPLSKQSVVANKVPNRESQPSTYFWMPRLGSWPKIARRSQGTKIELPSLSWQVCWFLNNALFISPTGVGYPHKRNIATVSCHLQRHFPNSIVAPDRRNNATAVVPFI